MNDKECSNTRVLRSGPEAQTQTITTLHCNGCVHHQTQPFYGGSDPLMRHTCKHPVRLKVLGPARVAYMAGFGCDGPKVGTDCLGLDDRTPAWCPELLMADGFIDEGSGI